MLLSPQLRNFCDSWRRKAAAYALGDLGDAFDRFFTSYVVFNRLYVEATHRLARRDAVRLGYAFPDSRAARDYVTQYCSAAVLTRSWEGNAATAEAIHQIAAYLREHRFALKLDPVTGQRRPDEDRALVAGLESRGKGQRAKGVLEALYAIRCNMFHGQKGFEVAQLALLRPAIVLLESTVEILYGALEQDVSFLIHRGTKTRSGELRGWCLRGLYFGAVLWIVVVTLVAQWVPSIELRLAA